MIIRVPAADVSTCRSKGFDGVEIERIYACVVPCKGPEAKNRKGEATEDFDSRPRTRVRFEVQCKKEPQKVRIMKVPKPLPGCSGGKGAYR